jgi:hypothetical protein
MNATDHLEQLARDLVGDGLSPNLYFVTEAFRVTTITTDRQLAYLAWRQLAMRGTPCSLEDREHGVLASLEAREAGGGLERRDDYARLTGDHGPLPWEAALRDAGREPWR